MTALLLDPGAHPWLLILGCTVIVGLWHAGIVAVLLESWRLAWPRAPATRQYAAAVAALAVVFVLTIATPLLLLTEWLTPQQPDATRLATSDPPTLVSGNVSSTRWVLGGVVDAATISPELDAVAVVLGVIWIGGVAVGIARVAGGWVLTTTLRRRAVGVRAPELVDALQRHSDDLGVATPALLLSPNVEAPVVLGAFAPAVILPDDAAQQLTADTISPLLAHELAHVKRRDYAVNLVQSVVVAILWFSPGAWWIHRRVRETREYCCDDVAVRQCGSPSPYVNALTTLAALNVTTRRAVPGIAGPRLIERIRRQLQEDVMPPFVRVRLALLVSLLAVAAVIGPGLVRLSAAAAARGQAAQNVPDGYNVPYMWSPKQSGSSLTMLSMDPSGDARCGVARIRNDANVAVSALSFVAVVSSMGFDRPVVLVPSELMAVQIPPGQERLVDIGLISAADAFARMDGQRAQVGCLLKEVQFANKARWQVSLNPTAHSAERAMSLEQHQLSRDVINAPPPSPDGVVCVDQRGLPSSPGAMYRIENEPGRVATCQVGGRWVEGK